MEKTSAFLTILLLLGLTFTCLPIVAADAPTISLDPSTFTASQVNQVFSVDVKISNVVHLVQWGVNVTWDEDCLALVGDPTEGDFMSSQISTMFVTKDFTDTSAGYVGSTAGGANKVNVGASSDDTAEGASGSGVLATLQFKVLKPCNQAEIIAQGFNLVDQVTLDLGGGIAFRYVIPSSSSATTTVSLQAADGPPIVDAGKNQTVTQGTQVTFDGSKTIVSGDDPTYTWTFTDGTAQNLTGVTATYTFNNPGNYTVTLTVTDSLGTGTDTMLITVTESETTPTATPTPSSLDPGATQNPNGGGQQSNSSVTTLPPTILGILVALTIFVLAGATFWLRRN
jgi:PKD repeat protein